MVNLIAPREWKGRDSDVIPLVITLTLNCLPSHECTAKTASLKYTFMSPFGGGSRWHLHPCSSVFVTRCRWQSPGMNYFIRLCRCSLLPHAINPHSRASRAVVGQALVHLSAQLPLYVLVSVVRLKVPGKSALNDSLTAKEFIWRPPSNEQ